MMWVVDLRLKVFWANLTQLQLQLHIEMTTQSDNHQLSSHYMQLMK
jgi:hypothetical protein